MAKWGEIKCPRCEEQDALWEGMERALEESDAREARLEAKLTQQDDLVRAAVAAALREAVDEINCGCSIDKGGCLYPHACPQEDVASILSLITEDAQAALDRVVAAERERIVSIYRELSTGSAVGAGDGHTFAVRYVDPEQFAAAIRKGRK